MRAGEFGVVLNMNARVDLSSATSIFLRIYQPNGKRLVREVPLPGTGQIASYQTVEGDFPGDLPGPYFLQLISNFGSTQRLKSPIRKIDVEPSIERGEDE
jgi:hypothetical protein